MGQSRFPLPYFGLMLVPAMWMSSQKNESSQKIGI